MLSSDFNFILFLVSIAALGAFQAIRISKRANRDLPPGPPGHWLFGNVIPPDSYRAFEEWTKQYGPLYTLKSGRNVTVIIGTQQAALDIMEKENASLVDRPHNISAGEVMSGNMRTLLVRAGNKFRKLRKALHSQLNLKVVHQYEPIQAKAARNVVLDILEQPDQHQIHGKRFAASVIMTVAYGKTTPTSYSDPEVQAINRCLARLGAALRPGAYLVDSFPLLRYMPGYLSGLKQYHGEELALFRSQLDGVRAKMSNNAAQTCFSTYLITKQPEFELDDNELAYLAGSMFGAGSDTTAASISIVIMAAATHQSAQKRVQDQLDVVVGKNRVPTFSDMSDLTEVQAFMQESFRWRPVSAGGVPHRATQDIYYKGYRIPAGATVIANHWSIGRDPEIHWEPEQFRPERWLNDDSTMKTDMKSFVFGFGRRICPGQHLATRSVMINVALILWAFNITEDPSAPIDTIAFTDTMNVHPLPFKARFEPRIENLRQLIAEST